MFDISWTEFLLIGVVALIVIGPKELPSVLRTLGQWTRKVRGMAAEFQNQFQEAMREAEMADLKKQVDEMAHDLKDFDPLKGVRDDVEAMGRDFERSLDAKPAAAVSPPGTEPVAKADEIAAPSAGAAAAEPAALTPPAEPAAAEIAPAVPADPPAQPVAAEAAERKA